MVSGSRLIRVLAGSWVLCLGLSNCQVNPGPKPDTGWPVETIQMDPSDRSTRTESIKGAVLRVEGTNYLVKREDGKEVSMYADATTLINRRY